ncbi:hypothetical protein ZEAMMB73_Zm00001d019057 [Zea mays]|uniref:Uncharacterized protein n=1 Tax=Zea mays TaxID=4577 RepID=A0A1D6HUQ8_MAIZE|nr:hypothetical protein ZEAMMB73_Zm00001d019057 [Zea mays]
MSPLVLLLLAHLLATATAAGAARTRDDGPPAPSSSSPRVPATTPPWPDQFHAVVVTNLSARGGGLQLIDLYYDWPRGRDLNIVRDQLSGERRWSWNVEWSNGTAFLFDSASCRTFQFAVGLLPPDWKARGAAYLGRDRVDGFDCHVWSNFVFARYYEDVATGRPVSWNFNGMAAAACAELRGGGSAAGLLQVAGAGLLLHQHQWQQCRRRRFVFLRSRRWASGVRAPPAAGRCMSFGSRLSS